MTNPVLIIIGAGPGVAMATGRRFAAAGYDIGLIARTAERTGRLADELSDAGAQVGWAAADVGDPDALAAALGRMTAHTERLDVLLYNAVAFRPAGAAELTAADLLADLAVGTAGLLTAVQAVLPVLRAQRTGTILATGSGAADHPSPASLSLGVQKAALRNLVQGLAAGLSDEGLHVATVTVNGLIKEGTPFAPAAIAEVFAELVEETAGDPSTWRTVVDLSAP
jgi:NADP-dependent 3-hydroxy acid dehydrogenase YdfG